MTDSNKNLLAAGVIIGIALVSLIVGMVILGNRPTKLNAADQAVVDSRAKLTQSRVEVVEATLALYYASYGTYPVSLEGMLSTFQENKADHPDLDLTGTESSINNLKDLDYRARGDGEAYEFTYIKDSGEKDTRRGEYQKEFH